MELGLCWVSVSSSAVQVWPYIGPFPLVKPLHIDQHHCLRPACYQAILFAAALRLPAHFTILKSKQRPLEKSLGATSKRQQNQVSPPQTERTWAACLYSPRLLHLEQPRQFLWSVTAIYFEPIESIIPCVLYKPLHWYKPWWFLLQGSAATWAKVERVHQDLWLQKKCIV